MSARIFISYRTADGVDKATALVFTGPLFGLVSTLGGALGLAQFLGVQPLGVALRDAVTAPDRAVVHHDWAAPRDPPASDLARA